MLILHEIVEGVVIVVMRVGGGDRRWATGRIRVRGVGRHAASDWRSAFPRALPHLSLMTVAGVLSGNHACKLWGEGEEKEND